LVMCLYENCVCECRNLKMVYRSCI